MRSFRQFELMFFSFALVLAFARPAAASTCYGLDPCHACHTCDYCKHCNSGGNPCGILLDERGRTNREPKTKTSRQFGKPKHEAINQEPGTFVGSAPGMPYGRYKFVNGHLAAPARSDGFERLNADTQPQTLTAPTRLHPGAPIGRPPATSVSPRSTRISRPNQDSIESNR